MATIKSYTSLEQSKKLAEILSLESADMYYCYGMDIKTKEWSYDNTPTIIDEENKLDIGDMPCWSLAALLGVLPVTIGNVLSKDSLRLRMDKGESDFNIWYDNIHTGFAEERLDIASDNPIDACYEMIIKLHEFNLL